MREKELLYNIALTLVPKIGPISARNLIAYIGSAEKIFTASEKELLKIPNIGRSVIKNLKSREILTKAEKELKFIYENNIAVHLFTDDLYPRRLKNCVDAPTVLFTKGNTDFNANRIISIVGTRKATNYGKEVCDELIKNLSDKYSELLVVSGLAYGIDIQAHKYCLQYNVPTAGVVGHGLNMIYPAAHRNIAQKMLEDGAIISDFTSQTKMDPGNFIRRNRIIAGLSDATIIVESAEKGGALITAEMAQSYNRDVFAFPGRANDKFSKGCNKLIRNSGAALITGIEDLEYFMGWEVESPKINQQPSLFVELSSEEEKVIEIFDNEPLQIDMIAHKLQLPISKISALLLGLEFKNRVTALPGNCYKIK